MTRTTSGPAASMSPAYSAARRATRAPGDHEAMPSGMKHHGPNRQMVTGGVANQHPQIFAGRHLP
jgi:hypothetical protein